MDLMAFVYGMGLGASLYAYRKQILALIKKYWEQWRQKKGKSSTA